MPSLRKALSIYTPSPPGCLPLLFFPLFVPYGIDASNVFTRCACHTLRNIASAAPASASASAFAPLFLCSAHLFFFFLVVPVLKCLGFSRLSLALGRLCSPAAPLCRPRLLASLRRLVSTTVLFVPPFDPPLVGPLCLPPRGGGPSYALSSTVCRLPRLRRSAASGRRRKTSLSLVVESGQSRTGSGRRSMCFPPLKGSGVCAQNFAWRWRRSASAAVSGWPWLPNLHCGGVYSCLSLCSTTPCSPHALLSLLFQVTRFTFCFHFDILKCLWWWSRLGEAIRVLLMVYRWLARPEMKWWRRSSDTQVSRSTSWNSG